MRQFLLVLLTLFTVQAKENWSVAGFLQPESVIYDETRDRYYVSNVNGVPNEKNGKGFISIMVDDSLVNLEWITGLNAPKGMAIAEGKLYVADIDSLREIDIASGVVVRSYPAAGAQFLNDVSVASDGSVYVSDMLANRIYRLKGATFDLWIEGEELLMPNGLFCDGKSLIVASWGVGLQSTFATETAGSVYRISLRDKSISIFGTNSEVGNLDGIWKLGRKEYIVSDYMSGHVYLITPKGSKKVLSLEHGCADLTYRADSKTVIVPLMGSGKVCSYSL